MRDRTLSSNRARARASYRPRSGGEEAIDHDHGTITSTIEEDD